MLLTRLLNACHHFPGFVYAGAGLCEDTKAIEIDVRHRLGSKPYLTLIEKHCTNALNILDRFHVAAKLNLALDEVRASEARRLVQDGYEPVLKKSR